jgi:transposase InsO family protein
MVEKQGGKHIKILRSDKGREYTLRDFIKYCEDNRIKKQCMISHTPQHNGEVERKNRTLVDCARSTIKGKNMHNGFWAKSISTTVYVKNRSPTNFLEHKTPYEALYGYKIIANHLRIFGSKYVIFHEYAYEVQKEDNQDLWELPKEGIESEK